MTNERNKLIESKDFRGKKKWNLRISPVSISVRIEEQISFSNRSWD